MRHPYEILQEIRSTNSKNEKLAIVKREEKNELFREVVRLCLDPFITFGTTKIPNYTPTRTPVPVLQKQLKQVMALANREVTGHAARDFLQHLLEFGSKEDSAVMERVVLKDFDAGFSESTVNKAWGDFIPEWPVMLCASEGQIDFPCIAQLKEDGMRVNIIIEPAGGPVRYFSRNGQPLDFNGTFDKYFLRIAMDMDIGALVLDGEALVVDAKGKLLPRKESNGIVRKSMHGSISKDELSRIRFVLWDVIPVAPWKKGKHITPYMDRLALLQDWVDGKEYASVVPSQTVESMEEAQELFEKYLAKGQEGLILKDPLGPWQDKRVKHQVKMKAEKEADLVVIGTEPHSKNPKLIGALVCETSDGKLRTGLGSGMNDDLRAKPASYFIGKIVAVVYNEVIEDRKGGVKSLFLPRLVEIRSDKSKANSLKELT